MSSVRPVNQLVDASPTKEFFIDILTKDISVEDCILDMVDNSLHSHISHTGLDVSRYLLEDEVPREGRGSKIKIELTPQKLTLTDNTGGIPLAKARDEVFRLGYSESSSGSPGLGVYGIGMKRAFFKLGRKIDVTSRTTDEGFKIHIDTEEWLRKKDVSGRDDWTFHFEPGYGPSMKALSGEEGTTIVISDFQEGVGKYLGLNTTRVELRRRLSAAYSLFLLSGIEIGFGTEGLLPQLPRLVTDGIKPARQRFNEAGVDILVMAGIISGKSDPAQAGWYIFCNGRLVLGADRSTRTGWGSGNPHYHPQFNRFVGYVNFRSDDPRKLPWATTKTNVVLESPVYQAALAKILAQTPPVLSYLRSMYPTSQGVEDVEEARQTRDAAVDVPITEVPKVDSTFTPPPKPPENPYQTLNYQVVKADLERIRSRLKKPKMSARKIGEYVFKYFLDKECD